MNVFLKKLQAVVYSPAYRKMYPLSEQEKICERFNEWNFTEEEEKYINKIYDYLNIELRDNTLSEMENRRNLSRLYKTKKKKTKDKEGNSLKEKVKVLKRGREEEKEFYSQSSHNYSESKDLIYKAIKDMEQGTVDDEDIKTMDTVLNKHKLNTGYQIFVFSLIVGIIILFLIKNIIEL